MQARVKAGVEGLIGGPLRVEAVKRLPRHLTWPLRPLPDFLVIGAQKSGTTTLYDHLAQHPQVRAAMTKEVHYFDLNYRRGAPWYRANFPADGSRARRRAWLTGEASPYYLLHPLAPQRAAEILPQVRLIAVLRHPVERTYSHYQHERAKGWERLSFAEAVAQEGARTDAAWSRLAAGIVQDAFEVQHYSYVRRGRYAEQLARWLTHFPREQLLIVQAEELFTDPDRVMGEVFEFLELPPATDLQFRRLNARSYETMPTDVRTRLTRHFSEQVRDLEALTGQEFAWQM